MQKGNTLIFPLIGVLVLVGGAFYLGRQTTPKPSPNPVVTSQTPQPTPTPFPSTDETANWKSFTNTKYGYSIKYPPDKFIDCSAEDSFIIHGKPTNNTICGSGEGPYGGLSIVNNTRLANQSSYPECYSTNEEAVKVGGIDGTKYMNILKSENNDCNKTVVAGARLGNYILLNNKGTILQIIFDEADNKQLNQILSTFKFL